LRLDSNAFDCEEPDLNEFFEKDAKDFSSQLLGKSYCFQLDADPKEIVCIFTISNDSVKAKQFPKASQKKIKRDIPYAKQRLKSFPAVLIGRLGVDKKYREGNFGSQVLELIKAWFREEGNKTGCRFVVVDAYNNPRVLNFYKKNGFETLFDNENEEASYLHVNLKPDEVLHTRIMLFDLIKIIPATPRAAN